MWRRLAAALAVVTALIPSAKAELQSVDLDPGWKFCRGDVPGAGEKDFDARSWETVNLPHTWNALDMMPGRPMAESHIGAGWYRRLLRVDRPAAGERIFLEFDGLGYVGEVYVDGRFVGGQNDGYFGFRLDITDALDAGDEHMVAIRVSNKFKPLYLPLPAHDWERYGGIFRDVRLLRKGAAHFGYKSVRIRTPEVKDDRATVTIGVDVIESRATGRALRVEHRLVGPEGKLVARCDADIRSRRSGLAAEETCQMSVETPILWSPDNPILYRVETSLYDGRELMDREVNALGFRWFRFDPDQGFVLNGRALKLVGANSHPEYPGLGNALPESLLRHDLLLMKQAGMNFHRTSHYPRSDQFLRTCDELGIMVLAENPFWHGSMHPRYGEELSELVERTTRKLVQHYGNHPSIVLWGTVNAVMYVPGRNGEWLEPDKRGLGEMLTAAEWPFVKRIVREMSRTFNREDPARSTVVIVGGQWQLERESGVADLADVPGLNGGALHKEFEGRRIYDIIHAADPGRPMIMTEGIVNRPDFKFLRGDEAGETTFWRQLADEWDLLYARPWFAGGAMWVLADYSAAGKYRRMGLLDFQRLPYEGYYFCQSQWSAAPMVHINGSWNPEEPAAGPRTVNVFTNCDEVELFLNGSSVARGRPARDRWPHLPHPPVILTVPYATGELVAVARRNGTEVSDSRMTEGKPTRIELTTERFAFNGDGRDVVLVQATVRDANGNRCYSSNTRLRLDLAGPAHLPAGCEVEISGGLAQFALQSIGTGGEVVLRTQHAKLSEGRIRLQAVSPVLR